MTSVAARTWSLPHFDSGALSALKWLALALMVVDHADAFVYQRELGTQLGRLVYPIFAFVLAYNLARPSIDARSRTRLMLRLVIVGAIAAPFHMPLAAQLGDWWPLNIMFAFASLVAIVDLLQGRQWILAAAVFLVSGALVEYWWPGLAFGLAVWWLYQGQQRGADLVPRVALVAISCASLSIANGSHTALLALPIIALASGLHLQLPRLRWAFYAFYPAHLALFWILGAPGI